MVDVLIVGRDARFFLDVQFADLAVSEPIWIGLDLAIAPDFPPMPIELEDQVRAKPAGKPMLPDVKRSHPTTARELRRAERRRRR